MSLVDYIIERFGYNEPFFPTDIIRHLNIQREEKLLEDLSQLAKDKEINEYAQGIYFIPNPNSTLKGEELNDLINKRLQNKINCIM